MDDGVGLDWEARGWCAHSQGSAQHPWADHGVCVEPAQLHLTAVRVLARIGKPEDGAHTRRGVHGILGLSMGGVWGACSYI